MTRTARRNAEKTRLAQLGKGWHFVTNNDNQRVLVYVPQGDE